MRSQQRNMKKVKLTMPLNDGIHNAFSIPMLTKSIVADYDRQSSRMASLERRREELPEAFSSNMDLGSAAQWEPPAFNMSMEEDTSSTT